MKKQKFIVTLTFSDNVNSKFELNQVAQNIANAIRHEADCGTIAPEGSEAFTTKIEVAHEKSPNDRVEVKLYPIT